MKQIRARRISHEAIEQTKLMNMVRLATARLPELDLLFHIPNGGTRNVLEAVNLKRQGVKAGVPDLFLPVARGKFHGLFIEMKAGKNKPTDLQKGWLNELQNQGYLVVICYSAEEAFTTLENYLDDK